MSAISAAASLSNGRTKSTLSVIGPLDSQAGAAGESFNERRVVVPIKRLHHEDRTWKKSEEVDLAARKVPGPSLTPK